MRSAIQLRLTALIVALAAVSLNAAKAQSLKDAFNSSTPIFYIGIDFSKTKLIDVPDANTSDIVDRQFDGLNVLVISEPKKYDVAGALHVSSVDHDLAYVNESNKKAKASDMLSTASADLSRFKADDIQKIVSGYDFKGKTGIGFLLVCEALSKSAKEAAYWATYVDMKTKKVLFTDRVTGKLGMGFGFRNFFATTIKSALDNIEKHKYKEWKSKAGA